MKQSLSIAVLVVVALVVSASPARAQAKNPSVVEFTSADFAVTTVTGCELDIVSGASTIIQTIAIAKANVALISGTAGTVTATYRASINVQPVAFGPYTSILRIVASALKSDDSPKSDVWTRVPGAPSKPEMK